ncbi:hypothetical protein [Parachitinimonas caeni]|uniref:SPW repeat-containing protein n=1 Tax=Parachitinimonas caeni TaxID=3031301 RepID=A0ABT7E3M6_9NEIS|nr:hypothetical protein [Parachitinimonas caeni]MDK2126915.1 hypothetical protein [Parachitinimonas caeni]
MSRTLLAYLLSPITGIAIASLSEWIIRQDSNGAVGILLVGCTVFYPFVLLIGGFCHQLWYQQRPPALWHCLAFAVLIALAAVAILGRPMLGRDFDAPDAWRDFASLLGVVLAGTLASAVSFWQGLHPNAPHPNPPTPRPDAGNTQTSPEPRPHGTHQPA